jgi:hypothetical protein
MINGSQKYQTVATKELCTPSQSIPRMKLKKELRIMDAKLEIENSIANLGGSATATTSAYHPDGSFCVVPPGSSYMSSSSM